MRGWGLPLLLLLFGAPSVSQEADGPLGLLLAFVKEDIQRVVPREMKPYEPGPFFLLAEDSLKSGAREMFDPRAMESLGVREVEGELTSHFRKGEKGYYVREYGTLIAVGSVERGERAAGGGQPPGETLSTELAYFVTFRWPDGRTEICLMSWQLVLARDGDAGDRQSGWRRAETVRRGLC